MFGCHGWVRASVQSAMAFLACATLAGVALGQPFQNPYDNPFDTPPLRTPSPAVPNRTEAQPLDTGVPELRGLNPPRGATESRTSPSGTQPLGPPRRPATPDAKGDAAAAADDNNPFRDDPVQPDEALPGPGDNQPPQREARGLSQEPEPQSEMVPGGLDPELAGAFNKLLNAGKFAEAIPLLESAATQLPTEIDDLSQLDAIWYVWFRLGFAYRMTGRFDEAIRALSAAAQAAEYAAVPAAITEIRLLRGISWFYKGEPQVALAEFEDASSSGIGDARPDFWKGVVLASQDRYRDAITAYSNSLRLANDYPIARNNRGLAYLAIGEYDFAIADFNEVIRHIPNGASAYYKRAIALALRGDLRQAITSYDEAIRLDPEYAAAYYNRGLLHRRLRNTQQANADLAKARQLNPQIETLARPTTVASR
jgi:tetratricopeptide (TPR) repeat protein